ncbi:MAG TPA: YbhN family protein [Streptosporangiaceae bacterium]|jgi:hypothetical protein
MSAPTPTGTERGPVPEGDGQRARRRRRFRVIAALLGACVIVAVIVIDRHTLSESLENLSRLDLRWFAAALACEFASLSAFGLSRRRLLRADGHQVRFPSVMAITVAGNSVAMSVPFAGAQLAAAFDYQQLRRRGLDPALTGWALTASAIASSSALALVLVTGAFVGGSGVATAFGFLGAAVFALPGITVILALRYPKARGLANRVLAQLLRWAQRLLRRPLLDPAALEELLERLAAIRLRWPRYLEVFALAVANWLGDCACLACAIYATGGHVPWQGLLLAYGAGAVAGSTGLTPGGFAVVEVTLTAALVAAGMNAGNALSAVLAYRLLNFWMILFGGGITMVILTRAREHRIRRFTRPKDRPPARAGSGEAGAEQDASGA